MAAPFRFALLGLSPVECSLLEALFMPKGHDRRMGDCERVTDMYRANLVIANADDEPLVRQLRQSKLVPPVLLVGYPPAGVDWPCLTRPIQLHRVIDILSRHDLLPQPEAQPTEAQDTQELSHSTTFAETQDDTHQDFATTRQDSVHPQTVSPLMWHDSPLPTATPAPRRVVRPAPPLDTHDDETVFPDSLFGESMAPDLDAVSLPPVRDLGLQRTSAAILLVGSPRLASSSLAGALVRFGFQVDVAHSILMAQERIRSRLYAYVMLDAGVLRNQTLSICSTLRRERQPAPHMIVVSDHGGVQRALSRLMGCDIWMVKPLKHQDLRRYLYDHLPTR